MNTGNPKLETQNWEQETLNSKPWKILVWLSGWVDSAVSAFLLKQAGYEVSCGFMINYLDEEDPGACPTRADLEEARKVAAFLNLPFYTFDYREEYEKRIVEYIYREYTAGRTPNPDVFCNNLVKFDLFLEEALSLGFDGIATGHYARCEVVEGGSWKEECREQELENLRTWKLENYRLLKWVDPEKDQSYFLSRLSPFQLSKALFPIGNLLKSQVRTIAREAQIPNAERKDSQWLCFIGKVSMKEFLEKRIPKQPGNILNTEGKVIGKHTGAYSYTIGQRRGIEIGGGPALFVIAKDTKANTISVWTEDEVKLYSKICTLIDWIGEVTDPSKTYWAKIRYRQEDQECLVMKNEEWRMKNEIQENVESGRWKVEFIQFQRAITPGQICVIYDDERVVGSGVIV